MSQTSQRSCHTSHRKLWEMGWTPLEHPSYSYDLPPCDFYICRPLTEAFGSQQFDGNAVKGYLGNWPLERPTSFSKTMLMCLIQSLFEAQKRTHCPRHLHFPCSSPLLVDGMVVTRADDFCPIGSATWVAQLGHFSHSRITSGTRTSSTADSASRGAEQPTSPDAS